MKKFLLILALILVYAYTLPVSVLAAPNVNLSLSANKRFVYLAFKDLKQVSKVSYTLTYNSNGRQKGFVGGFKTSKRMTGTTRRQIMGTCSSGKCVYHTGITGVQIDATFTLRSGGTTKATRSL